MFRISIQDSRIRAFDGSKFVEETTVEKIQDFCKKHNIAMPLVWHEDDEQTLNIAENYFRENINDSI